MNAPPPFTPYNFKVCYGKPLDTTVKDMTSLPPVSREQAFLETYFQCMAQFAYDKAKEACEKERDTNKVSQNSSWGHMVNCLIQLGLAEKAYATLIFLGQRWFGRKDNLRSQYSILMGELRKLEDMTARTDSRSPDATLEKVLGHLAGQLSNYLTARSKTMDFFEQLSQLGTHRNMNYGDLLIMITDIIQSHQNNFHHPILSPLKTTISLECDIISQLLQAQVEMSRCQFVPSIMHLNDAHSKLTTWPSVTPVKETKKLGFGSSKQSSVPALYQWLVRYKGLLVLKFSLYFYDVLSKHSPQGEMKSFMSKASIDFYGKIVSFQKRTDAVNVSLVYDTTLEKGIAAGAGYQHPDKFIEPPKGLSSYPAVFSYPMERPEQHWPIVVSMMNDNTEKLDSFDKIVYLCDEMRERKIQNTYFMVRIEPGITFVVIFETKKSEKDSYINNFMTDLSTQLRGTKVFSTLRPGVKA